MRPRLVLPVIALALSAQAALVSAVPSVPVVYAHRGGAGLAPENTLGAFRQAQRLWGDRGVWLEMDAQLSKDGELVIIHDATLDRTTLNCTGNVMDHTVAELRACDARAGWQETWPDPEPIPTAREVLTEGKDAGWRIMLELKNIPYEPNFDPSGSASASALAALLAETGFPHDRLLVQSFFPTSLDYIELNVPDVKTVFLTISPIPVLANGLCAAARGYEVTAPDEATPGMDSSAVAAVQATGRMVVPWTIDESARIAEVASMGVDGIITNYPDRAYEVVG